LKLNKYIEHTLLKVDCTEIQITKLIKEAVRHQFYGICIPSYYIPYAKSQFQNSGPTLISVAGFPLGYEHSQLNAVQ